MIKCGDIYESKDPRDYDPGQSNGIRRVKVVAVTQQGDEVVSVRIINISTGRQSVVVPKYLEGRRWKKI